MNSISDFEKLDHAIKPVIVILPNYVLLAVIGIMALIIIFGLFKFMRYKFNIVARDALQSKFYNENITAFERLEAFNRYLHLHGNGNSKEFMMKLILENRSLWESIVQRHSHDKFYNKAVNEIRKILH